MNAGTAKIVTNAGVGVYTITQVFWDPDSGTFVTGTTGFTNVTATDVNLVDDHEVDKIVCFRYQTHYDADTGPIIWAGGGSDAIVEGGTEVVNVPDTGKGWIFNRTRSGIVEIAHGEQRSETYYVNERPCEPRYTFDETGHCLGWYYLYGGDWLWESPWGISDPTI
jgi:hypothetical protein